jgi:peptidoglycan/xylan/chitin deacetylase (PgdA/CDA1 family)
MKARFFRPPFPAKLLFPDAVFRIETTGKEICLTFDDGPDPLSTPSVLKCLAERGIKAVFFCTGYRAELYPSLMSDISHAGHLIGNHGYHHLNGWATSESEYIENVQRAGPLTSSSVFRPPYGKITFAQYNNLKNDYRIVFWDVMAYDFDERLDHDRKMKVLRRYSRNGSVVCLHDSVSAMSGSFLDEYTSEMRSMGYTFAVLP